MSLRPYKFIVQAVVHDIGEDGQVIAEQTAEPVVVFGCEALAKWADGFPAQLAAAEAETPSIAG